MKMETAAKQANIFFVDDEIGIRKIVRLTLEEQLPCHVTCFDNAVDCLDSLKDRQERCSVLITDIKMHGMDGMELLSCVRQLRPSLPVLIITGHGDVPMAVKAIQKGALNFIEKPLDEQVLLSAVETALKQSANIEELTDNPLTCSEIEILRLISEGRSNSEMAYLLHRSVRTIERHRYQLMHKLNVGSPAELTKIALTLGLTSPQIK